VRGREGSRGSCEKTPPLVAVATTGHENRRERGVHVRENKRCCLHATVHTYTLPYPPLFPTSPTHIYIGTYAQIYCKRGTCDALVLCKHHRRIRCFPCFCDHTYIHILNANVQRSCHVSSIPLTSHKHSQRHTRESVTAAPCHPATSPYVSFVGVAFARARQQIVDCERTLPSLGMTAFARVADGTTRGEGKRLREAR
jgi:hypothetical protein